MNSLGLQRFAATHPQWLLGLMLLALHAAIAWGIESSMARGFLLAHFGFFLIWQPVWRGTHKLNLRHTTLVMAVGLILLLWNSWWLMAFWLSLLFGLIGGNVPGLRQRGQRLVLLLAALYLLAHLLIWVVPHLFPDPRFPDPVLWLVRYGLLLLPPLIMALKVEPEPVAPVVALDLFYSLMLLLLVGALVLGSVVVKVLNQGDYPLALAQTLCVIAVLLFTLSWLWTPHSGFVGLGNLMSRYLMSVGLPFERWMQNLANLAERESDPRKFLQLALDDMAELPWVLGISWQTPWGAGNFGHRSKFDPQFRFQDLTLTLYTRWAPSPALFLHLKLLTQLLGYFYDAKRREQIERQNAYSQAIFDTGARLTHDVKNLLQSLKSLCAAVGDAGPGQGEALQALMQRQLPQITQRLQRTLEKLEAPHEVDAARIEAGIWWESLKQRYSSSNIGFFTASSLTTPIPLTLFDSVADNLIQNALNKSKKQPEIRIEVELSCQPGRGAALSVCDNGTALGESLASRLFEGPIRSGNGLGIGLYQASRQSREFGYQLRLASNLAGHVCFELAEDKSPPGPAANAELEVEQAGQSRSAY